MASQKNPKAKDMSEQLNHFLADTFILYVKTLNFHWNMTGPQFFMYHKLLEEQYQEMAEACDEIAERIRMLGGRAAATMQEFLELGSLSEGKGKPTQDAMIRQLAADHTSICDLCHAMIATADEKKDQGSSDLLVDRLRVHDKFAWLLRSHFKP